MATIYQDVELVSSLTVAGITSSWVTRRCKRGFVVYALASGSATQELLTLLNIHIDPDEIPWPISPLPSSRCCDVKALHHEAKNPDHG